MEDTNFTNSEDDKKLHYESIKKYFRKSAADKRGFYSSKSTEGAKRELKKRNMWKIYTSALDGILKDDIKLSSVIDVGCGMGNFTLELAQHEQFKKIVGIDLLKETFGIARENENTFGNVSFLQGNLLNLPFIDRSFDLTVCLNTLHHIHKEDFCKAIHELARITNKYLMLEIRNKNYILDLWFNKIVLPKLYRDLPQYSYSLSELNYLMKKHGFQLKIIRGKSTFSRACRCLLIVFKRND